MTAQPLSLSPFTPLQILLVEDTPTDARLIRAMLRQPSFEVTHVERLSDALAVLRSAPIDVILLDLNLPDSRGAETLDCVLEQAPGVAIVVITGNGDEHSALAAVAQGAQDYLIKGAANAETIVRSLRYAYERSRAEAHARTSEERFRALVENGSDGIALGDREGNVLYSSPAITRILGYSVEEFVGTNFLTLLHPDDLAEGRERFAAVLANRFRPTYQRDLRYRHRDGTWRYLEILRVNRLDDPAVRGIVANFRDVTERREACEQIEKSRRVACLGRVAASVAHEFSNVLMGIQPFAEILKQTLAEDPVRQKPVRYILDGVKRGRLISQQILRFASPAEPRLAPIDLGQWMRHFLEEARPALGGWELEVLPAESIMIRADAEQLSQVMLNLVTNARDASANGTTITVGASAAETIPFLRERLHDPQRFAVVFVRDHGQGIRPEVLNQIFEPLFTTKRYGGTGLGLAVVHQIISEHGGKVVVESEPGLGSTFYIALPLDQATFDCPEPGGEGISVV